MDTFLTALGLVLLIEGLVPFVAPGQWRKAFLQVAGLGDGQIRFIGLAALLAGLVILVL